jgi:preprotein translocase subunit SecE
VTAFLQELIHIGLYKRSQGRITRQLTFAAMAVVMGMGFYRLSETLPGTAAFRYGLPGALMLLGGWAAYRAVNVPAFADFLIAVEAEMNKVSWPSRPELFRASLVVLVTIFLLAGVLTVFDLWWKFFFSRLGIF